MGDPEPRCSEFIPSALVWLLGPCPWLLPGNIASNYTTRGAQPLRYHAKIQTDLITTTSRKRTQWGRPPPRRVFKQNTEPQNNGFHCTSRSTLFHTGNKAKYLVCLSCTMHCVVSLLFQLCRLGNGSGKRKINPHPFTFKLLSISIGVNSHVLNSPQTFQNHLKNSKNILLVHEVVVKRHAASRKRKCSLAEKNGFSLLLKNESNQLSKTSCTSRKTKLHQKRLKFTCKCEACSKCISQTIIEVLVHKRWLQKPLQHHAKFRKRPKTYQSQMLFHHSAANPELCTKKTLLSPNSSCHTKSCRNVAHVHRINGSLYFHILPPIPDTPDRKRDRRSRRQAGNHDE